MIYNEWRKWLNNLFSNHRGRSAAHKWARPARPMLEVLEDRAVPTVGMSVVNDNWAFVADNDGSNSVTVGDTVRNDNDIVNRGALERFYGVNGFGTVATGQFTGSVAGKATINDAIANTTAGGTVNVLEGTYAGQIVIDKPLSLLGANAGVHPTVGTSTNEMIGTRGPESIIAGNGIIAITPQAADITIDGFRFEGENSRAISSVNKDSDRLRIANNIFAFTNNTGSQDVIKIQDGSHTGMVIAFNVFQHTGAASSFQPEGSSGNFDNLRIANNRFNGGGDAVFQATSVALSGAEIVENEFDGTVGGVPGTGSGLNMGRAGDILIQDNYFHDLSFTAFQVGTVGGQIIGNTFERMVALPGFFGQAFELWGGQSGTTVSQDVTIANNVIHYNDVAGASLPTHGLRLRAPVSGPGIDASTITVFNNCFVNGEVRSDARAIRHFGNQATAVNASGNWWGTTDQAAIAALMEGPVDFSPYLTSGTDTSTTATGFQGDFSNLRVTSLGAQTGTNGRIQEAIELVTVGGTVNVAAGTYVESVTVNNSVTVLGAQAGLNPADRTNPALESIVSAPSGTNGFSIGASNVTIRGFTVTTTGGGVYGVYEATQVTGTVIDRNIVHGFGGLGISLAAGSSGAKVTENDVSNNYAGIYLSSGASNAIVRANVVHDHTGTGFDAGSGIVFEGNNTNVLVSQNFIRDNAGSGIYVWDGFGNDFSGTQITSNSITGNGVGFNDTNTGATDFDAAGNWWGTHTAAGVAAEMSGNVNYSPWMLTGVDTNLLMAGFQGTPPDAGVSIIGSELIVSGSETFDNIVIRRHGTKGLLVTSLIDGHFESRVYSRPGGFTAIRINLHGGDDRVVIAPTLTLPVHVVGGAGNDTITTALGKDFVYGDAIDGSGDGHDTIITGAGNDFVNAGNGTNYVAVGAGNNTVLGGSSDDQVWAANGNNDIRVGDGDNQVWVAVGINTIVVGNGANFIQAGNGRNTITAGNGANSISTGAGVDTIVVGDGANFIQAGNGRNTITAGNGANSISTGTGVDTIVVGDGANFIQAGNGANAVTAGKGANYITTGTSADVIRAGNGRNWVRSSAGNDRIVLGDGGNTVVAGDGADVVVTGAGSDSIFGGTGADLILAGAGNDSVEGGLGNDVLVGGQGSDYVAGEDGRDLLFAGEVVPLPGPVVPLDQLLNQLRLLRLAWNPVRGPLPTARPILSSFGLVQVAESPTFDQILGGAQVDALFPDADGLDQPIQ